MSPDYELFTLIVRTEIRLYNVLDQRLRAEHGLVAGQYEILRFVEATDDCRVADISARLAITVGATSRSVDRLEASGWVARRPNPQNRRSSLLELTDEGRSLFARASVTVEAELGRWLGASLTDGERSGLAARLTNVLTRLESSGAGQPTG